MRQSKVIPEIIEGVPFPVETDRFVKEGLGIIRGRMTAVPWSSFSGPKKDDKAPTDEFWVMKQLNVDNVAMLDEKTQWRILKALATEGYRLLGRATSKRKA